MTQVLLKAKKFQVELRESTTGGGRIVQREVVAHPGAVVILPILDGQRFVFVRNIRHSIGQELLELPAGTREPGEPPIETARRELEEETGYRAALLAPLATFYTSPGITDELMHAYLATGLTFVGQKLDEGEEIVTQIHDVATTRRLLSTAALQDAKSLAVLGIYFAAQSA